MHTRKWLFKNICKRVQVIDAVNALTPTQFEAQCAINNISKHLLPSSSCIPGGIQASRRREILTGLQ